MIKNIKIGDVLGEVFEVVMIFGGNEQINENDESGLGVVYLVRNIETDECHALKTFQDKFIYEENTFDDFKLESLEWIKLKPHPNIVSAIITTIIDERPFLILEPIVPVNGKQTLKHYLHDPLTLKQILDWSIQFCHGMEFINDSGIKVHGDIKPDNILIFFNRVKITDFGLLELFESTDENLVNQYYTNNACGTLEYMAPEVFKGKRSVQSDIYSFGVVLYQLVNNGIKPFVNDDSKDWSEVHQNTIIPDLDSELNNIIHKCLEKTPYNRYHSFKELRIDLERIFNEKFDNLYNPNLIDIGDDAYYAMLGHSYCEYGELEKFEKSYEKSLKTNDNNARVMYASDLMNLGEFEKAKDNYEIVVKNLSKSENEIINKDHLYFNLGHAYHSLNQIFDAMKYYEKTLIENKDFIKAKVNLGNCYRLLGDYENSCKYYDEVLEIFPTFYEALYNKALLLCEHHQFDEAESLFSKIDEKTDDGQRFLDKSLIFSEFDKMKSLLELSKYLVKHDDVYSKYLLLDLHLAMGKFDLAKGIYDDLIFNSDNKNDIRILTSPCFYKHGHEEFALHILEELRVSGSKKCKYESYLLKANLIRDNDIHHTNRLLNHIIKKSTSNRQKTEAYNLKFTFNESRHIRDIHQALKLSPNYRYAHLNYIKYYIDNKDWDKALGRINHSSKIFKNDAEIYFLHGQICWRLNQYEEAKHLFELSLKYGKIDIMVYFYIRDCYIKLDDENKAMEYEAYGIMLDKYSEYINLYQFSC